MGNTPTYHIPLHLALDKFLSFPGDFAYVVYGILFIFSAGFVFGLSVIYKKVRRKFPLKVNCWFCNNNTTVSYELSDGWDCPQCKQYNGFNKDGDYNKIIPEHYNSKLNDSVFKNLRTSIEGNKTTFKANGFCKLCNINQQLKIQQLALFVPLNENNYYEEIEQYKEKLEKAYKLCLKCEKTLQETLEKQKYDLLQNRLNGHKSNISLQRTKNLTKSNRKAILILLKKNGILGLKVIHNIIAICLFLALVIHFESEYKFLKLTLPDFELLDLEPLLPDLKVLFDLKDKIYNIKKELSFAGLFCCFIVHSENQMSTGHVISLAWGFFHMSLWSTLTGLHLIMSAICLFLNIKATRDKYIYINKKSLHEKFGFQPVNKVFPEVYNFRSANRASSPLLKNDSFASLDVDNNLFENKKNRGAKQKLKNMSDREEKNRKTKQKENEVESLSNEEKEKTESTNLNSSWNSPLTKKSSAPPVETDKNSGESSGSFNDVYTTLNSLQLGGKQKKSNKPPNFLFANHNFSEGKNSSPIIKPAKFIKNLNSTSWAESNECNSRSSTPSSGYSSQKPEKIECNRYDFPKTVTPVSMNSFSRHSPSTYFDYYDGNHGFYNNVNYFSPGFVPFQQFPGSLGHTTVYTCTRPTNFSFPFSPYQGYPDQKFSNFPRFSDASGCDKLFQETSKSFGENQKWLKFKTFLYYFSIFLNFITIMSLVYFISAGIILVDWKLPKFNFFI